MNKLLITLAAVLMLAGCDGINSITGPDASKTSLTGRVTSQQSGHPQVNFQVVLFQGDQHWTENSNSEGYYHFASIKPGTYTVRVLPYYSSTFVYNAPFTVNRGRNVLDLAVPPV